MTAREPKTQHSLQTPVSHLILQMSLPFLYFPHSESMKPFTEQWDKLNTHIAMTVYTSNILMTTCKCQLNLDQKLEKLTKQQSIQQNNALKWHNQCLCSTYQSHRAKERQRETERLLQSIQLQMIRKRLDKHQDKVSLIYIQPPERKIALLIIRHI